MTSESVRHADGDRYRALPKTTTRYRRTVPGYDDFRYMKAVGFPYEEWPQELKDEYAYNRRQPEAADARPVI